MKSKFPKPVNDELLDDISNAGWFSCLDLKAGFNQTKSIFSSQFWLSDLLALLIHFKCVIVFFDDILVYNCFSYKEHL